MVNQSFRRSDCETTTGRRPKLFQLKIPVAAAAFNRKDMKTERVKAYEN
jgi:hypothetical protein